MPAVVVAAGTRVMCCRGAAGAAVAATVPKPAQGRREPTISAVAAVEAVVQAMVDQVVLGL
jgi:hypothetical protein